ncbi:MAG: ornithine carbamoyltransferase [Myxococcales bacterium]|nr:MAG: ornithine carbamoyltransferase [Myxococcales bacterium]
MAQRMKGRHLISLKDYSREDFETIFSVAARLKEELYIGRPHPLLAGKTLGMIFQKPSLRTMVSFQVGVQQLGGYALYLGPDQISIGKRESTEDIAHVLSSYVDGIMARTFAHSIVEDLAKYSRVPVINGLTDFNHPCQILADLFTVLERKRRLDGLKLAYVGDGNNVTHSLLYGCATVGMSIALATPEDYRPDPEVVAYARELGRKTGAKVTLTASPKEAAKGADVLYTDVWASMGQEAEKAIRAKAFKGYQINMPLLNSAHPDAIVLHCLPAHYDEEITYDVVQDPRSAVFQQAENRLHAQKAVMALLMGNG